jgi:hypothetical protein
MKRNKHARNDDAQRFDPYDLDPESLPDAEILPGMAVLDEEPGEDLENELMGPEFDRYHAVSPELPAGDLSGERQGSEKRKEAEDSGAEPPGGHVAAPDQDNVDEIGRAVGMEFQDNQELRTHDEVLSKRDRHRWELDRRSADGDSL